MGVLTKDSEAIRAATLRSELYGVDRSNGEFPFDDAPASETTLTRLSGPVLEQLASEIVDSPIGIVLADRAGRLSYRNAGARSTLVAMDQHCVDVGFSLAEADAGTNGVGTSLETKKPTVVVGNEHFAHSFQAFTCANAPIVHPVTHRLEGTVGLLCPVQDTNSLLLPTATRLASRITDLLLEQASPEERFLLEQFLLHRRRPNDAVATLSAHVLIATPSAQRLLAGVDQAELWDHVSRAISEGTSARTEFGRDSGAAIHLRCQPVYRGDNLDGAIIELKRTQERSSRIRRTVGDDPLPGLAGVSAPWRQVVRDTRLAARSFKPTLIVGERGTGKLSIAQAIGALVGSAEAEIFDSAEVLVEGPRNWVRRLRNTLGPEAHVIMRRIDLLSPEVAAAAAAQLGGVGERSLLVATTEAATANESGRATLLDLIDVSRIDVPPLRHRRDDIAPIARHIAARLGRPSLPPEVTAILFRQEWTGNARELGQILRATIAEAGPGTIEVRHLPRRVNRTKDRRPLHGLRQREAEAIVDAISLSGGNKKEAAELLGISRATLYRRVTAFGINLVDI